MAYLIPVMVLKMSLKVVLINILSVLGGTGILTLFDIQLFKI
jgi:hypothetical protein